MSFGTALLYSLLGMGVVFFALILLMLLIRLMTAVGKPEPAVETPAVAPSVPAAAKASAGPAAPGSAGELKLYDTDPRTAAMLMAIVADELQAPLCELRFLSIREIKE